MNCLDFEKKKGFCLVETKEIVKKKKIFTKPPKKYEDLISFYDIKDITNLKGMPQEVAKGFCIRRTSLETLKGGPKKVGGYFEVDNNKLTTLEGAPKEVGGKFDCSDNKLISLKGAPKKVKHCFNCSHNKLTTLEGAPERILKDRSFSETIFDCSDNKLTSLKGVPKGITILLCYRNKLSIKEILRFSKERPEVKINFGDIKNQEII